MATASIGPLIINSPYEEPAEHWRYDRERRTFSRAEGRRPAGYVVASEGSQAFDDPGVDGLCEIYKNKLTNLFGDRFLQESRTLKNSKNSALFEFLFCVGNPKGIGPAKRIAGHILEHL